MRVHKYAITVANPEGVEKIVYRRATSESGARAKVQAEIDKGGLNFRITYVRVVS
jgi:hypothetical protein